MAQTQLILGWPYILPKGLLVLLWLGWFSLNVLYCSGLPESVCATQFKVTLRVVGLAELISGPRPCF